MIELKPINTAINIRSPVVECGTLATCDAWTVATDTKKERRWKEDEDFHRQFNYNFARKCIHLNFRDLTLIAQIGWAEAHSKT